MPGIIDILRDDGRFGNFVHALKVTGLEIELQQDRLYTVFAPTDDAFGALPQGSSENLYKNTDHLKRILKSHILPGRYSTFDLRDFNRIVTGYGDLQIHVQDGQVYIGGALIEQGDIEADNGVIHVISSVLIPSMEAQS